MGYLAREETQDHKETVDQQELLESQDHKAYKEVMDQKENVDLEEIKVNLVHQVQPEKMVSLDPEV